MDPCAFGMPLNANKKTLTRLLNGLDETARLHNRVRRSCPAEFRRLRVVRVKGDCQINLTTYILLVI